MRGRRRVPTRMSWSTRLPSCSTAGRCMRPQRMRPSGRFAEQGCLPRRRPVSTSLRRIRRNETARMGLLPRMTRKTSRSKPPIGPALVEELESRLLYSADVEGVLPGAAALLPQPVEQSAVASVTDAAAQQAAASASSGAAAVTQARVELVFVDASLPDADQLIAALRQQAGDGRTLEVVKLDAQRDGLEQITRALAGRHDIDAVHLIGHGDAQGLQIGATRLDADSLAQRAGEVVGWSDALRPGADLLLYGCDLASSEAGRAVVDGLATLTGADVAASSDATGGALLGGDWDLEYADGSIQARTLAPADWNHVLATAAFQQGSSSYAGAEDTFLELLGPGNDNSADTVLYAGRSGTYDPFQMLLKFNDIIGSGAGQIPQGSVITAVTLKVYISAQSTFTNPTFSLYRMLAAWDDTSTYNSMGSGVDGSEARSSADQTITESGNGAYTFASNAAMIASVQAWANNPSSNQGWYIFCDDYGSKVGFSSAEVATVANRPLLSVTFTPPTPPTLDLDASAAGTGYSGAYTENVGAAVVDTADATITAGSSSTFSSMTVTLTNKPDGVLESLSAVTTSTPIAASYDSGTGVLTLSGSATAAQYQQVLRTVTYNNNSDNPNTTARTINVVVTDSYGQTATATSTLSVTRVNDAPAITSNGGGSTASINVAETLTAVTTVVASDPDSTVSYSIVGGADSAKFSINTTTGVLTFSAAPDYESPTDVGGNNVYDVIVQASDGTLTDTQAIAVTVTDVSSALVVTTTADTNDSGLGTSFTGEQLNAISGGTDSRVSLREALIAANTASGTDTITFNILTGGADAYGAYVITTTSALPTITGTVVINAASQPGTTAAGHPLIVLDGNGAAAYGLQLSSTSDGSTIRGLVIRDFTTYGLYLPAGSDSQTIVGNYIGAFNADGTYAGSADANDSAGIYSLGANLVLGGTTAADRNVISGNGATYNVYIGPGSNNAVIQGNYIGTTAAGTAVLANNGSYGLMIESAATNVTIGGTAAGA
ncbi:MAG: DUF4347 domain-containing protein, partial [Aquabacterium sp.]